LPGEHEVGAEATRSRSAEPVLGAVDTVVLSGNTAALERSIVRAL
jgi:hypothetical protein